MPSGTCQPSKVGSKHGYLFPQRDEKETDRLNRQHSFLMNLSDGELLLSPSIPSDNLRRIADIGTGTGIWLEDLAQKLSPTRITNPTNSASNGTSAIAVPERQYDGFDVSSSQFPRNYPANFTYQVHSILEPWSSKYHGVYDLVHVRLLVVALKLEEYEIAIKNILQILKPGGYLQWTDLNHSALRHRPINHPKVPRLHEIHNIFYDYTVEVGYSRQAPITVYETCKMLSGKSKPVFVDVQYTEYTAEKHQELMDTTKEQSHAVLSTLLPVCLLYSGKAKSQKEANVMAKELVKEVDAIQKPGVSEECGGVWPIYGFGCVVGRKARNSKGQ